MRPHYVLAIVIGLATISTNARAQDDPLVTTIDQLTEQGDCQRALTLLTYARATAASISGRRGICFSHLGLVEDAEARAVDALRSPNDAWVVAHRDLLLSLIRTTPTVATPPEPQSAHAHARVASVPTDPCPPGAATTPRAPTPMAVTANPVVDHGPVPDPQVTTERDVVIEAEPCVRVARSRSLDVVESNPYFVDSDERAPASRSYDISCIGQPSVTVLPNPYR